MRKQIDSDPASVSAEARKRKRELADRGIDIDKLEADDRVAKQKVIDDKAKSDAAKKSVKKIKKIVEKPVKKVVKKKRR